MNIKEFESQAASIAFVKESVQKAILEDLMRHGEASIILTGGSTIRPYLTELATLDVPWEKVWVILSDERWVPATDESSNEYQLKELFLNHLSVQPKYISLKTGHNQPRDAIHDLKEQIKELPLSISCAILSIGSDGHIASLFPEEHELWKHNVCFLFGTVLRGGRISLNVPMFKKVNCPLLLLSSDRLIPKDDMSRLGAIFNNSAQVLRVNTDEASHTSKKDTR